MANKYISVEYLRAMMMRHSFRSPDMTVTEFTDILKSADVRENVRGEWIEPQREGCVVWDKRAYAQCSICGYKQFFGREKNFCPNCGCSMKR